MSKSTPVTQVSAKLADGLTAKNSPQSAASVAKGNAAKGSASAAKGSASAAKGNASAAKRSAPKGNAAKGTYATDGRMLVIAKGTAPFGRPTSNRRAAWDCAVKSKTIAAYIAAGGAAKYLPRWLKDGTVKFT